MLERMAAAAAVVAVVVVVEPCQAFVWSASEGVVGGGCAVAQRHARISAAWGLS